MNLRNKHEAIPFDFINEPLYVLVFTPATSSKQCSGSIKLLRLAFGIKMLSVASSLSNFATEMALRSSTTFNLTATRQVLCSDASEQAFNDHDCNNSKRR